MTRIKSVSNAIVGFLLIFLSSMVCNAQRASVSGGGNATGPGGSIAYTIGQVDFIEQIGPGGSISQGMQQPLIIFTPLPVLIQNFMGHCNNGKIYLSWETLSESNNESFIVEKSADGQNWYMCSIVEGAANSNELKKYNATDATPFEIAAFYRLKQKDIDGNSIYSNTILVNSCREGLQMISIYPNPTTDGVYISVDKTVGMCCEIRNQVGQIVRRQALLENLTYLDIRSLPAAEYTLTLYEDNNWVNTFKIIKQ